MLCTVQPAQVLSSRCTAGHTARGVGGIACVAGSASCRKRMRLSSAAWHLASQSRKRFSRLVLSPVPLLDTQQVAAHAGRAPTTATQC